jgi:gamma-glutamyltranspeptidase/glutathione hydrolase
MKRIQEISQKRSVRIVTLWVFIAVFLVVGLVATPPATLSSQGKIPLGVPGVRGGVVTTSEPAAAQVGAEILRQGGNAFDAAAAVQFALNVVEPQSSGIGGGGFMMVHLDKQKQTLVVDCRETAPAAATPDMFASQPSFGVRSTSGYAVGVPGTLRCVDTALDNWGTYDLSEVLQPAIRMAEEGIRVSSRLEESIPSSRLDSEPGNLAYDEAREVFRPGGVPLAEGDLLIQPDLAETFRVLAENGSDAFYTGEIAEAIVETQLATRSGNPDGVGRMTLEDLANYEVAIREPVEDTYRGYRIVGMPPPSSGGLTSIQILKMLERFPIGDESQGFGFGATRTLNVMIEAGRLAFADRAVWIGDDDFVDVPSAGLLHDDYIASRSALINPDGRQANVEPGDPRPFDDSFGNSFGNVMSMELADEEGQNTTHFTVIDRDGNIVTWTSTIESAWGTGLMVPGYGFMLNNELTDFNSVPTFNPDPDNFNPGANDVAPGKRPRSSMAPTIIFDGKKPLAAFGSPGGSTIIWSVTNIAMNLIDHEQVIQEAIDAPRIAQTSANGSTSRELGFSDGVIQDLINLGHSINPPSEIGSVQAVVIDQRGHIQFGSADKRRIGGVVSVRPEQIGLYQEMALP